MLFADIRSSLELIADRDPEDASKILDAILRRMIEAVHRYEGTVNRVMGDGIMALFGAPLALEDHAVRACYAALMMQEIIKRYSEDLRRTEGFHIEVRIGANSGEVLIKSIQSDLQMDYAAVGETTHLAARMEQIATPGSILITANVAKLAEGYVDVKPLGPIPVKGLRNPVEVFELMGGGSVRSRLQATALRGLTRFVGRATEMEALREAFEWARAGHGQVVAVAGEAGVGKSRLLYEFLRSDHTRGWLVLESNSVFYGRLAPYLPVIQLLKSYFNIDARDDLRAIREKVTAKILSLDQTLHEAIPPALYLLEALSNEHPFHGVEPAERREYIALVIKRIVLAESLRQPVVLLFDDLHWNDSASLGVLEALIAELSGNRVLLLLSSRSRDKEDWEDHTNCRRIWLDPLPRDNVEELLRALLGGDPMLTALKSLLTHRAEGNPFFIEEIVRNLFEAGALSGHRGEYLLAKPVSSFQVPPMVQAVIASRIDRLAPAAKRLLHEASVIGKDVPFALLQLITDLTDEELRAYLADLTAGEFLYEVRLFPEIEYTFEHSLTQEVAYAGLLQDHRREIHGRIVASIEKLYPDRLNEHVERLAHHSRYGGIWPKALSYLRRAGAKAVDRQANREAVELFGQALEALKHLPQDRNTLEQAIDIRFDIRNALQPLGDLGQILDCLRAAEQLARQIGDQRRLGWVASYLTEHLRMLGNPDPAAEAGEQALTIARDLDNLPLRVVTNLPMGLLYHATGEYSRAIEFFQWNIDQLKDELMYERFGLFGLPSVHSRSFLVWCLAELGEFADGLKIGEEAIRIAKVANQPFSLFYAYLGIGTLYLRMGEAQQAIPVLERALELGNFPQIPVGFSYGASYLGYALTLAGRTSEGLPLLEQTTSATISTRFVARHSLRLAYLGEAYMLTGRLDDAVTVATRALELACNHKEHGHEAHALRLLGEVATKRNEFGEARSRYLSALALARTLRMRPLVALCHWGLARSARRDADRGAEEEHASSARAQFQDMGMAGCLRRMEAEFSEAGVTPSSS